MARALLTKVDFPGNFLIWQSIMWSLKIHDFFFILFICLFLFIYLYLFIYFYLFIFILFFFIFFIFFLFMFCCCGEKYQAEFRNASNMKCIHAEVKYEQKCGLTLIFEYILHLSPISFPLSRAK